MITITSHRDAAKMSAGVQNTVLRCTTLQPTSCPETVRQSSEEDSMKWCREYHGREQGRRSCVRGVVQCLETLGTKPSAVSSDTVLWLFGDRSLTKIQHVQAVVAKETKKTHQTTFTKDLSCSTATGQASGLCHCRRRLT